MSSEKFYSTGRGGAGNISHGDRPQEPTFAEEGAAVPQLRSERYTTGRGGAGNIRNNDDAQVARRLQDVDGPAGSVSPENPTLNGASVGRGGYGNVIATQQAQEEEKQSFISRVKGLFTGSSRAPSVYEGKEQHKPTAAGSDEITQVGPSNS